MEMGWGGMGGMVSHYLPKSFLCYIGAIQMQLQGFFEPIARVQPRSAITKDGFCPKLIISPKFAKVR